MGLDKTHNLLLSEREIWDRRSANYASFERSGFVLKSLFDVNPRFEGMAIRGIEVRMMDELVDFLKNNDIDHVLTIPVKSD